MRREILFMQPLCIIAFGINAQRYSGLLLQASGLVTVVQELYKIIPGHGAGKVITLDLIAVLLAQEFQLAFGFNTLRHHADLQAVGQSDDSPDNVLGVRRLPQFLDERSEEHTSELQSRPHLVCRLLLEKKKKKNKH